MQKEITMAKEFIVAIELGSSKITGLAGKKNIDGSISVLASVREDSTSFIRKGVVHNIDKTAQCIAGIVQKLSTALKTEIKQAYVGVGGQSIHSIRNTVTMELAPDTIVTQQMVDELMDSNGTVEYDGQELLDAVAQEYEVDNREEVEPVGIQCTRLQGVYLNILCRQTFYSRLNKCFDQAGVRIAEMYLAPLALADAVLTDTERRSGCALVDLGADTTTVAVYHRNILRHLVVIPLGANNITKDIASLQMEESRAEKMKMEYGRAFTPNADIDDSLMLSVDDGSSVENRRFIEIVEGRVFEIIENVKVQIDEFKSLLLGGIIITGGGSNLRDIERAFRERMEIDKVRRAGFVTLAITAGDNFITSRNAMMNTALALLAKGDMNCAGQPLNANPSIFDEGKQGATDTRDPRDPKVLKPGEVQTEAEKQKLADRKKQEEEERARKEEEDRLKAEEEAKNRGLRGVFRRMGNNLRKYIAEDE